MASVGLRATQVLLGVLAIGMTGCSGDSGGRPPDNTSPAATPTTPMSTHTPTDSSVPLPDGIEVEAAWEPSVSAESNAAIQATIDVVRSMRAISRLGDADAVPYRNYVTGSAERVIFDDFILPFVEAGLSIVGVDRLHHFRVMDATDTSAIVIFCDDQTDLHVTNRETGEVIQPATPLPAGYRLTQTVQLVGGRWKVSTSTVEEDVAECVVSD